ncbi:MAG: molybdopterin-dependent oxidoreductase [Gammaproteobacteria bacterium]|nr:molybdopterin-dependent oxidoreductase [Gammaproteobacteria bacterium]
MQAERHELTVNGKRAAVWAPPMTRLSEVLREHLALKGTKVGCDAGDCGACTVLLDGKQVCACLVPLAQAAGRAVATVEGLADNPATARLQSAFEHYGAAQCGICTPGMLMAAATLMERQVPPSEAEVADTLGGVLCRCTGYRKIMAAVLHAAGGSATDSVQHDGAALVGQRVAAIDGNAKVTGTAVFGADAIPGEALRLRVVRSPHQHAEFTLGDCTALYQRFPGLALVMTAEHIPHNGFGVYPDLKDQPVLAPGIVRYRGEAVLALVGDAQTLDSLCDDDLPITWAVLPAIDDTGAALSAPPINPSQTHNVLTHGKVYRGHLPAPDNPGMIQVEGEFETGFVEHAYIEPEAGYARPLEDGRLEVSVCTQTPHMDRDEVALILDLPAQRVRVRPPACGGGFGGKLDQSVQPLVAAAAWRLGKPVACVYSRIESMAATTKRHPAMMQARAWADSAGTLRAFEFDGVFNTGAYASWGPTVAGRVPVHCMGPYRVPNVRAQARAVFTHGPPSGAFRGFGVPQAAIAHETLMDELAGRSGLDPLEFRRRNALRIGDVTATGQRLSASAGLPQCLDVLRPHWHALRQAAAAHNRAGEGTTSRHGVGIGCMWYGCGNTSMSNPSSMRVTLARSGEVTFYNGAQDIGQGSTTVLTQIMAEAIGIPLPSITVVGADTDLTLDAGKTSASRQTYVSGRAAQLAGEQLRAQLLHRANVGPRARIELAGSTVRFVEDGRAHTIALADLPSIPGEEGSADVVLVGEGTFDPPTQALDENGQGEPYGTYGFAAQIASVEVDIELGTVRVTRIVAAHDVGAAVNPMLVEGQIEGGIAQGIGLALTEEFIPGRTENLHDYLVPTIGDVPPITSLLIESPEPTGPYGAKGIGEPALVPTAPAILNAVFHATGVRFRKVPLLPHRLLAGLKGRR